MEVDTLPGAPSNGEFDLSSTNGIPYWKQSAQPLVKALKVNSDGSVETSGGKVVTLPAKVVVPETSGKLHLAVLNQDAEFKFTTDEENIVYADITNTLHIAGMETVPVAFPDTDGTTYVLSLGEEAQGLDLYMGELMTALEYYAGFGITIPWTLKASFSPSNAFKMLDLETYGVKEGYWFPTSKSSEGVLGDYVRVDNGEHTLTNFKISYSYEPWTKITDRPICAFKVEGKVDGTTYSWDNLYSLSMAYAYIPIKLCTSTALVSGAIKDISASGQGSNYIAINASGVPVAVSDCQGNSLISYVDEDDTLNFHVEGSDNYVESGWINHVEGHGNYLFGDAIISHIEGAANYARNCRYAHVEGGHNDNGQGDYNHLEGRYNIAGYSDQHVGGVANERVDGYEVIGMGTVTSGKVTERKNARVLTKNGCEQIRGLWTLNTTVTAVPSAKPNFVGELLWDSTNKCFYIGTGTSAVSDWKKITLSDIS